MEILFIIGILFVILKYDKAVEKNYYGFIRPKTKIREDIDVDKNGHVIIKEK